LTSDFSAAYVHLDRAFHYLSGDDETSSRARDALGLLMDAVATAKYTRRDKAEVLQFPRPSVRARR
jgi:hypothetical protein